MRAHQEPVFRLAYLLLGSYEEAQEAAQETFIRAARYLPGFDLQRPLRPWLLKMAGNLSRNRYRTASRYLAAVGRLVRLEPRYPAKSVEDLALQNQESAALWQAVRKLSQADQQVIYLRYFLDLPVEECALACGAAPGTIKSRTHRAIQRLRAVIEQEFPLLMEWSDGREGI